MFNLLWRGWRKIGLPGLLMSSLAVVGLAVCLFKILTAVNPDLISAHATAYAMAVLTSAGILPLVLGIAFWRKDVAYLAQVEQVDAAFNEKIAAHMSFFKRREKALVRLRADGQKIAMPNGYLFVGRGQSFLNSSSTMVSLIHADFVVRAQISDEFHMTFWDIAPLQEDGILDFTANLADKAAAFLTDSLPFLTDLLPLDGASTAEKIAAMRVGKADAPTASSVATAVFADLPASAMPAFAAGLRALRTRCARLDTLPLPAELKDLFAQIRFEIQLTLDLIADKVVDHPKAELMQEFLLPGLDQSLVSLTAVARDAEAAARFLAPLQDLVAHFRAAGAAMRDAHTESTLNDTTTKIKVADLVAPLHAAPIAQKVP